MRATATSWRRCRPTRARWPSGSANRRVRAGGRRGCRAASAGGLPARGGAQLRRVRCRRAAGRRARLDGPGLHAAAQRAARHDHARARQADAEPHAGQHARRRHRPSLRGARARRAACTSTTANAPRPAPATDPGGLAAASGVAAATPACAAIRRRRRAGPSSGDAGSGRSPRTSPIGAGTAARPSGARASTASMRRCSRAVGTRAGGRRGTRRGGSRCSSSADPPASSWDRFPVSCSSSARTQTQRCSSSARCCSRPPPRCSTSRRSTPIAARPVSVRAAGCES